MRNRRSNPEFIQDRRLSRPGLYKSMISLKNHCRLSAPLKGRPTGGPEYRLGLRSHWTTELKAILNRQGTFKKFPGGSS